MGLAVIVAIWSATRPRRLRTRPEKRTLLPCASCGFLNRRSANFCAQCGQAFAADRATLEQPRQE
jgi:hypothetical protein